MFLHINYQQPIRLQRLYLGENQTKVDVQLHLHQAMLIFSGANNTQITLNDNETVRLTKNEWYLQTKSAEVKAFHTLFVFLLPPHGAIFNDQPILDWYKGGKSFTIPQHLITKHPDNAILFARSITQQFKNNDLNDLANQYNFTSLLIALSRAYIEELTKFTPLHHHGKANIFSIEHFIADHMQEHLTVSQIASHFQITPEYLANLFQKNEHITVTDYVNYLRISGAKDLLISTNLLVKQIAYYYGFTNTKYFFRLFKEQTGLTPTKYRNLFQK
jgi:AraC-like DNA-binding protein